MKVLPRAWDPPLALGCFGYFGFGGAWLEAAHPLAADAAGASHCDSDCPLRAACWQRHRRRARELFPELMTVIDHLVNGRGLRGQALISAYHEIAQLPTMPDVFLARANAEDGDRAGRGWSPLPREHATLRLPLRPLERVPEGEEP